MSRAHPIFERVFKTYDKLNNVVQENLRGVRVVKAYVREAHEVDKFNQVSDKIYRDFSKAERMLSFSMPLMQFALYGCMLGASWLGAGFIVGGTMTTGELMTVMTYSIQILTSLMMLSMIVVMIAISRASAERVAEVLDEKSDITNPALPGPEASRSRWMVLLILRMCPSAMRRKPKKCASRTSTCIFPPGRRWGSSAGRAQVNLPWCS